MSMSLNEVFGEDLKSGSVQVVLLYDWCKHFEMRELMWGALQLYVACTAALEYCCVH
jgi:hypothetical protein